MKKAIMPLVVGLILVLALAVWRGCQHAPKEGRLLQSRLENRIISPKKNPHTPQEEYEKRVAEEGRKFSEMMNASIAFYGRVVDQDGKPLEGVEVRYESSAIPLHPVPWGSTELRKGFRNTDGNGLFSIDGIRGASLTLPSLHKEGYREAGYREYCFRYSPNEPQNHKPDPSKPVEFMLIRDDLPQAGKIHNKILSFVWNTGPVKIDCGPIVGLIITPKRNGMNPANKLQKFDWSVDVRAVGFGMIVLKENAPKVAPINGYEPSLHYNYYRNAKEWRTRVNEIVAIRTQTVDSALWSFNFLEMVRTTAYAVT